MQKKYYYNALCQRFYNKYTMKRPLCPACNQRPCAVNYYRDSVAHYRTRCEACIKKKKKIKAPEPRWKTSGYVKKSTCDKCGFKSKYSAQLLVYHIDGNLHNAGQTNLKTICLNCTVDLKKSDLPWMPGDLLPDS
jgi:hypothetical protein